MALALALNEWIRWRRSLDLHFALQTLSSELSALSAELACQGPKVTSALGSEGAQQCVSAVTRVLSAVQAALVKREEQLRSRQQDGVEKQVCRFDDFITLLIQRNSLFGSKRRFFRTNKMIDFTSSLKSMEESPSCKCTEAKVFSFNQTEYWFIVLMNGNIVAR